MEIRTKIALQMLDIFYRRLEYKDYQKVLKAFIKEKMIPDVSVISVEQVFK